MTVAPAARGVELEFKINGYGVDPRTTTGDNGKDGIFQLLSLAGGRDTSVPVTVRSLSQSMAEACLQSVQTMLTPDTSRKV